MHCVEHVPDGRVAHTSRRSQVGPIAAAAIAALLLVARSAGAVTFVADPAFGIDGSIDTGFAGVARDVAVQATGRIVVLSADGVESMALAFRPDGTPDPSFGDDGVTRLPGTHSWSTASGARILVDPDDRIVLSGETADGALYVARLLSDGALDPSFGDGGVAVPAEQPVCTTDHCARGTRAIARDAQGRIVVAAAYDDAATSGTGIALLRVDDDGMLDATFGSAGVARAQPSQFDRPGGIAIAADGRIFAVATRVSADWEELGGVVAAFTGDGTPDDRFAHDGGTFLPLPGGGTLIDVAVDARGRPVVVGTGHPGGGTRTDLMVQRWLPSGVLDRTFGVHGFAFGGATDFGRPSKASGNAIHVLPDGTILATGSATASEHPSPCAIYFKTAVGTFSASGVPGAGNTRRAPGEGFAGTTLSSDGALLGVGSRFPPCHVVDQPPRIVLSRLVPVAAPTPSRDPVRIRPRGTGLVPGTTAR